MSNPPLILPTSSILVKFSRDGDRFTHRLLWRQEPIEQNRMESFSEASCDDWPGDPPLQQVVVEQVGVPPRTVALGVGMTGPGHWSLAAEAVGNLPDRLQFDWACRIQRPADRLGSSYQAIGPMTRVAHAWSSQRAEWLLAEEARLILNVTEGQIVWNEHASIVSIVPVSDIRRTGTHTWRYCWDVV